MKSFFEYLEAARSQPEGVRRQIAFWVSFLMTGLILLLWFVNLRLTNPPAPANQSAAAAPLEERSTWRQKFDQTRLRIKEGWRVIINQ